MDNKNIQSYDSNAKKRVFEGIKPLMHQDLRESITKGIRMRPSRKTDYPRSVGLLYLSPKHLVLATAGDIILGPVGIEFEAEWQALWSDLDLAFFASVWVLFPL